MRRRSRAGGERAKSQRHKAVPPKRRSAQKPVRRRGSSPAGQDTKTAQLTRELNEALEQQAAISKVLQVMSASPAEIQPVLDAVAENAARLCDANNAVIFRLESDRLRHAASYGGIPTTSHPSEGNLANRDTVSGRAVCDRRTVHVHDLSAEDSEYPVGSKHAKRDGHRTTLATPLLREGVPIGAILIRRMEVRPFSDKQIALLETFAHQAAIAIENVRLFEAEQQHTRELTESLEQQTATSEVLRIISRSPTELEPVFQAILANATRLCDAKFGALNLYDGEVFRGVAFYNVPPEYADMRLRQPGWRPHPRSGAAKMVRTKQPVKVDDLRTSPAYLEGDPFVRAVVDMGGARTLLLVPMLKDDALVGLIAIYRQEVRPFTDKQIALVQNFAAQAVIAIENTRLLSELRQRTDDLTE